MLRPTAAHADPEMQAQVRSSGPSRPIYSDEIDGIQEINIVPDRSMMTPEQTSQRAELLSSAGSENGFEKVSGVAATLYIEMKKCIK